MNIEVLYFAGCPSHGPTLDRIKQVLEEEGLSSVLTEVKVTDAAAAQALRFLGSPTVRVNALDVEPAARSSTEYGMMCRTYIEDGNSTGVPSNLLIRAAVREALARARDPSR